MNEVVDKSQSYITHTTRYSFLILHYYLIIKQTGSKPLYSNIITLATMFKLILYIFYNLLLQYIVVRISHRYLEKQKFIRQIKQDTFVSFSISKSNSECIWQSNGYYNIWHIYCLNKHSTHTLTPKHFETQSTPTAKIN